MASWLVIGAARGIGFEYIQQLSATPSNTIFALIRSQSTASTLNDLAASRKNIHVLEADIFDPASLSAAVSQVSEKSGGKLDVLVHNAYSAGTEATMMLNPTQFTGKEADLEREISEGFKGNVLGPIYTINAFLPLLRAGTQKKLISISTAAADGEFLRVTGMPGQLGYATSKAGGNIIMTKYASELGGEGFKTLAMSPGWVQTDAAKVFSEDEGIFNFVLELFRKSDPKCEGMSSVQDSVKAQLEVIENLTAEQSGKFVSHHGNREWL